jgi:hypothetical protein
MGDVPPQVFVERFERLPWNQIDFKFSACKNCRQNAVGPMLLLKKYFRQENLRTKKSNKEKITPC